MNGVAGRQEKSTAFCYFEDEKTMLLSYIDKKKKGKKNILALTTMHSQVKLSVDERKKPRALVFLRPNQRWSRRCRLDICQNVDQDEDKKVDTKCFCIHA